jgi:hypothetical protein
MNEIVQHLIDMVHREDGFVIGRVALVVLIVAIIIVAGLIAFVVPN